MALDLSSFRLGEMLRCSLDIRRIARELPTMESTARRLCRYFYDELRTGDGPRACTLVRAYKLHPYAGLPVELQHFARRALESADEARDPDPDMRCLTLLATVGDEPAWNDRRRSLGHQAIPLASEQLVARAPMISQLIHQFGVGVTDIIRPSPEVVRSLEGKTYGVFHVEEAAGSPYIPAQAPFVDRYGIRSVLGFGGSVRGADLFALILFSRIPITSETADRFRTIALDVKGVLLPFGDDAVFD